MATYGAISASTSPFSPSVSSSEFKALLKCRRYAATRQGVVFAIRAGGGGFDCLNVVVALG